MLLVGLPFRRLLGRHLLGGRRPLGLRHLAHGVQLRAPGQEDHAQRDQLLPWICQGYLD